jgi:PAS domain S-box-containing protein
MKLPVHTFDEDQRLDALRYFNLPQPPPQDALNDLARLAALFCEAPIAAISFVDEGWHRFETRIGCPSGELPCDISFFARTRLQPGVFVVSDAAQDERFATDPLVVGDPHVRFFAGVPLFSAGSPAIGTLCVMGVVPRQLTPSQTEALLVLSRQVIAQLEIWKQTEELHERASGVFQALQNSPIALAINRWSDLTFIDLNAAYANLVGWRREEILGRTPLQLHLLDSSIAAELNSRLDALGWLQDEVAIVTRSGETRHVMFGTVLVEVRGESYAISSMVDITAHKQAEDVLRRYKNRLSAIFENEPGCVELVDREGRLLDMNPAGLAMLEVASLAEAQQYQLTDFVLPQYRTAYEELLQRVLSGESGTLEFEIEGRRGTRRWLETHAAPLYAAPGQVEALLGVTLDVTERKRADEELRKEQMYLQTALKLAGMGVWYRDFQSNVRGTLQGSGPITGLPESELPRTYADFIKLVHPEDRESVEQGIERAKAGGDYDAEFRIILSDNSIRWVASRGRCLLDSKGVPFRLTGVDYDITERRRAEVQIRQLNRVYAVLSEINQTIVRVKDPQTVLNAACRTAVETGRFRMAWIGLRTAPGQRIKIAAHAGASAEDLKTLQSMYGEDASDFDCAFTTHALQAGQHAFCNSIADDPRAESWRTMALRHGYRAMASLPLKHGDEVIGTFNLYSGEPNFFTTEELRLLDELAIDIAFALESYKSDKARRDAEQALRESEERFRQLAENIQEVFWMKDPARNELIYVSPGYERIWGRTCASIFATPHDWPDAIHPDDRARVLLFASGKQRRGDYDETYRIERPDGMVRWIHDRAFPVRGPGGEIIRIVGTTEDITAQRRMEEQFRQAQKMEAIGRLAGGVAHDFNNLLVVIGGYGSLLLEAGQSAEESREAVREIVKASERAAGLTRQLLAFSRRQVIQAGWIDLNEVVRSVATMLARILGEDVRLQLNLCSHPLMTYADAGMLDQVLINLAVNARDAMPRGGLLTIETTEQHFTEAQATAMHGGRPGQHVSLRVSDTGSGISPENLPHLFEPFFTTKEPGKGTGLGLATVFGIVTQHDGFLHVESKVNEGTTVQIWLASGPADARLDAVEAPPPSLQRGTETILIVEDEASVRLLTRTVLEQQGYRIFEAATGREALLVWDQHADEVALLLTDIVMPEGMSGFDLANRLRERNPKLRILFTSGYSSDIAGRSISLQPGQGFLQKPCSPRQLLESIRHSLDS